MALQSGRAHGDRTGRAGPHAAAQQDAGCDRSLGSSGQEMGRRLDQPRPALWVAGTWGCILMRGRRRAASGGFRQRLPSVFSLREAPVARRRVARRGHQDDTVVGVSLPPLRAQRQVAPESCCNVQARDEVAWTWAATLGVGLRLLLGQPGALTGRQRGEMGAGNEGGQPGFGSPRS